MEIVIILGLILLNGVLSMSEIALVSARKSRLETDAKKGSKAAGTALKLANSPDIFLATIQIGNTLVGILTGNRQNRTAAALQCSHLPNADRRGGHLPDAHHR